MLSEFVSKTKKCVVHIYFLQFAVCLALRLSEQKIFFPNTLISLSFKSTDMFSVKCQQEKKYILLVYSSIDLIAELT